MENTFIKFDQLKKLYPDEWILLGDPEMQNTTVLGGTVVYHSKDKKEVCYIGRDKTEAFSKVTIAFAGDLKHARKIQQKFKLAKFPPLHNTSFTTPNLSQP